MKRSAVVMAVTLLLFGCHKAQASKEKLLRRALADTNVALTEAQNRAAAYQAQSERFARKLYRHKRTTSKK